MNLTPLIFSNALSYRLTRHILFWVAWFVIRVVYNFAGVNHVQGLTNIIQFDAMMTIQSISGQIPFCYGVLYIVLPLIFARKKYLAGAAVLIGMLVAFYFIQILVAKVTSPTMGALLGIDLSNFTPDIKFIFFFFVAQPTGVFVCCCLVCSLKFLKFWYVKQQENVTLVRENIVAELQLLKAQVHPHFLFNTLNNIYSFSLTKSPLAADLLEKLSDILQYMIFEGQNTRVRLDKEIQLLKDYIGLEKVRYGDRLDISMSVEGKTENKLLAPLLMIPFVENSFKHGSSKMLKNPKVDLTIRIEGEQLVFILINNKPATDTQESRPNTKGGIGLKNVEKRLKLLYPGKHDLKITSTETSFSVELKITMEESKEVSSETELATINPQSPSYANT